jgi:hypothetical protein
MSASTPKRSRTKRSPARMALATSGRMRALFVEHAFRRGDNDLRSRLFRRQRFAQEIAHLGDVTGAIDLPNPFRADPRTASTILLLVLRRGLSARDEGMSWPPVAAE